MIVKIPLQIINQKQMMSYQKTYCCDNLIFIRDLLIIFIPIKYLHKKFIFTIHKLSFSPAFYFLSSKIFRLALSFSSNFCTIIICLDCVGYKSKKLTIALTVIMSIEIFSFQMHNFLYCNSQR